MTLLEKIQAAIDSDDAGAIAKLMTEEHMWEAKKLVRKAEIAEFLEINSEDFNIVSPEHAAHLAETWEFVGRTVDKLERRSFKKDGVVKNLKKIDRNKKLKLKDKKLRA